jgi:hypothetical protein
VVPWLFYVFYGNVLLIVLMLGWDWWRGRLVKSFVLGSAGLVAACRYLTRISSAAALN